MKACCDTSGDSYESLFLTVWKKKEASIVRLIAGQIQMALKAH